MTNHFAALMLDRFRQELAQLGYSLNIHIVDREDMARCALPATFIRERCSGILCVEMFDRAYDEMLCQLGLPTLFVDGPNKGRGNSLPSDQIYMENTAAITRLVNDMLELSRLQNKDFPIEKARLDLLMVLDDALLAFDGQRLEQALDLLLELAGERQILLLTCPDREGRILQNKEITKCDWING